MFADFSRKPAGKEEERQNKKRRAGKEARLSRGHAELREQDTAFTL